LSKGFPACGSVMFRFVCIYVAFRDVRRIELFSSECSDSFLSNGHLFTSFASLKKRCFYSNSFNNRTLIDPHLNFTFSFRPIVHQSSSISAFLT